MNHQTTTSVRSMQTYLRKISKHYKDVLPIISDGIFSTQMNAAIKSFQTRFGLQPTGIIDDKTWERIVSVYDDIMKVETKPRKLDAFPSGSYVVDFDSKGDIVYIIQVILNSISQQYTNIQSIGITGIYDVPTSNNIKTIQTISGVDVTGYVDKDTWNILVDIYEIK